MSKMDNHEQLLEKVLDGIVARNNQVAPGTPMAKLKEAIENNLNSLPPLDFQEFDDAVSDTNAVENLIKNAPDLIGWNADKIIEWIENISKKI